MMQKLLCLGTMHIPSQNDTHVEATIFNNVIPTVGPVVTERCAVRVPKVFLKKYFSFFKFNLILF